MDLSDNPTIDIKVYDQSEITNAITTFTQNVGNKVMVITKDNSCFNSQIPVDSGKVIQIRIKKVRNPLHMGASKTSFEIETKNKDGKLIDHITTGISGQCNVAADIKVNEIKSSSKVVGTKVKFEFNLQSNYRIQQNGALQIWFP